MTDMESMFKDASLFNQYIGDYNVSNVTNMKGVFKNASLLKYNLSKWTVDKVTSFESFARFSPIGYNSSKLPPYSKFSIYWSN